MQMIGAERCIVTVVTIDTYSVVCSDRATRGFACCSNIGEHKMRYTANFVQALQT